LTSSGSAATIIRCPRRAANRLVTNGLGGFASSTISGEITRRYHGFLIAALPAPQGASGKPRVDDCRVFSGTVHVMKAGCRWADAPLVYRPREPAQRVT
jgi:hypothetical protein